jgi:uncharacterized membrane protein YccC
VSRDFYLRAAREIRQLAEKEQRLRAKEILFDIQLSFERLAQIEPQVGPPEDEPKIAVLT